MDLFELGKECDVVGCYDRFKYSHIYFKEYYPSLFEARQHEVKNVLELGVAHGGCLRMWRRYFPKANIYGVDINDSFVDQGEDRIFFTQGRQEDRRVLLDLNKKVPSWDVVVDDGSHKWHHIVKSYETLMPHVKPGGFYIIEDVMTEHPQSVHTLNYFYNIISSQFTKTNSCKRYTEIGNITFYPTLIVIKKRLQ